MYDKSMGGKGGQMQPPPGYNEGSNPDYSGNAMRIMGGPPTGPWATPGGKGGQMGYGNQLGGPGFASQPMGGPDVALSGMQPQSWTNPITGAVTPMNQQQPMPNQPPLGYGFNDGQMMYDYMDGNQTGGPGGPSPQQPASWTTPMSQPDPLSARMSSVEDRRTAMQTQQEAQRAATQAAFARRSQPVTRGYIQNNLTESEWSDLYGRRESLRPGTAEWKKLVMGANMYNPLARGTPGYRGSD
jgi:hypothetical protein